MRFTARAATSPAVDVQPGGGLAAVVRSAPTLSATPDVPELSTAVRSGMTMRAQPLLLRPIVHGMRMRGTMAVQARVASGLTMTASADSTAAVDFDYFRDFVLAGQADLADETLTGFVVQNWTLTGSWLKTAANGGRIKSDGWDFRFEDQAGVKLPHTLVAYDGTGGSASFDLRIPSWAVRSDFRFRLKYGKELLATEADPAGCWQRAAAAFAWPSGADLTGRGRSVTPSGVTAGASAGSGVFAASSYARKVNPSWPNGLTALAVELQVTPSSAANGACVLRIGGTAANSADFALYTFTSGQAYAAFTRFGGSSAASSIGPNDSVKLQRQHVIAGGQSGSAPSIFIDGAAVAVTAGAGSVIGTGGLNVSATENVSVGASTGEQTTALPGTYGRVIVWPFMPSAAWAAASYRLQANAGALIGMGAENAAGSANRSPVCVPMVGAAVENVESVFDVAGRSWDPEGGTLTAYIPSSPAAGTSRIVTGKVGYKPQGGTGGQTHLVPIGVRDPALQSSSSVISVSVGSPSARRSGMSWTTGATLNEDTTKVAAFESFRGNTPIDITMTYSGGPYWGKSSPKPTANEQWDVMLSSSKEKPGGTINKFMDMGISVCHAMAMLVQQERGQFKMIARGDRDAAHTTIANRLKSWLGSKPASYPKLYLCFGQEVNISSAYPWAWTQNKDTPADYVNAYRHVANIYIAALGDKVKITWNTLRKSGDVRNVFPGIRGEGDGVIDLVTLDAYDNGYDNSYFTDNKAAGFQTWLTGKYNGASGWEGIKPCMQWAAERGMKFGIQEWAPSRKRNNLDPGDTDYLDPTVRNPNNKYYMEGMRDFFAANAGNLEFEIEFNQILEDHLIQPESTYLPQPSRAYRGLWRVNPLTRPGGDSPWPAP